MRDKTRELKFHNIYNMATMIEEVALEHQSFIELAWGRKETLLGLIKPAKISLLYQYIYAIISIEERNYYLQKSDIYWDSYEHDDENDSLVSHIYRDFDTYEIKFEPFVNYVKRVKLDEDDDWFYKWFLSQEKPFEQLWEKLTDEVFHLLFANRTFLLAFNQALADFLRSGSVSIPSEYLDNKGVIKRASHIPVWLKKAVFYRDHGRCVICQKDLSGLLGTDRALHYDHIVPLNMWGTNDPSNFQLLCEKCNLEKSGNVAKTAYRYTAWWDY